jgi:hypothetical protein
MHRKKWFENIKGSRLGTVLLLQVDLANHSHWFLKCEDKPKAVKLKQKLAEKLRCVAEEFKFDELYWAGDGGIYVAKQMSVSDNNHVVDAADGILYKFEDWRKKHSPFCDELELRVSAHRDDQIYIHPHSGYWTGQGLNTFIKEERKIARPRVIAVTNPLRSTLTGTVADRFPLSPSQPLSVHNFNGTIDEWHIHYDKKGYRPISPALKNYTLTAWIANLAINSPNLVGPMSAIRTHIGGATLLQGIESPDSHLVIALKHLSSRPDYTLTNEESKLLNEKKSQVSAELKERKQEDQERLSTVGIIYPISDFPVMEIEYYPERYSFVNGFHVLLRENPAIWNRIAPFVADFANCRIPGILVTHIAVITASEYNPNLMRKCRHLIACQRQNKVVSTGAYSPGNWGTSIGEQVSLSDESVEDCVRRGIREELLGATASNDIMEIFPIATLIEHPVLNLGLLYIVEVSNTYLEVVRKWQTEAIDKNENMQIIALPIDDNILLPCIREEKLTDYARKNSLVIDQDTFRLTDRWDIHPSTPLRMAATLWFEKWRTRNFSSE